MKSQDTELETDPFLCTCGPCKRFWRNSFQGVSTSLQCPPRSRAVWTSSLAAQKESILKYGDRVMVRGKHPGSVRFVGFLDDQAIAPKLYVGVKLDDNVKSLHNGIYNGKRFFHCPAGHGEMVRVNDIRPLPTANPRPPVRGNKMYPSYMEVQKRRKEREEKLAKLYSDAQTQKHYTAQPAKSPRVSPRYNKTTQLRMGSAPQPIVSRDPNDIAFLDEQKKEKKKLALLEATLLSPEEQQMKRWRQAFGGREQGERMASTLQKLHHAYQEGLSITKRRRPSSSGSSDT